MYVLATDTPISNIPGGNSYDGKTSVVFNGQFGLWRTQGSKGKKLSDDNPAAHEFGHFLGLDDKYIQGTDRAMPGYEGNIMACAGGASNINASDLLKLIDLSKSGGMLYNPLVRSF